MTSIKKRKKPRGVSVSLRSGPLGVERIVKELPVTKSEIELKVAEDFCAGNHGMRPHIKRFGRFTDLEPQPENSIDFRVSTDRGTKWLELAEFAPLHLYEGKYENVSGHWDGADMAQLFLELVQQKNSRGYGNGVILLVYQTHDRFFVPPPIVRTMPVLLKDAGLAFEAVYAVSPSGLVVEAWPGDVDDQGPRGFGKVIVGPFS
ncbi:hypothetical protein Q2T91_16620 [Ralstonia pseudosolanacearum]|uniref:hypothetical protein n=1 Tax=Ralstonia pseudosolanacearum TaxID=1310165 RepID=UPI001FF8B4DD|nr:hypothetical protein [Ralstonia pseudosolanacearum]